MSILDNWRTRAARLPAMFAEDARFWLGSHTIHATPRPVGTLHVPSGRLVTGDAVSTIDFVPLARPAPVGDFAVEVSVATLPSGEQRLAAMRLLFSPQPIAGWELADETGYDGGLGILMDADTIGDYQRYVDENSGEWWYGLSSQKGDGWEYGCFRPDEQRAANCAYFTPGAYEGPYLSYWALDASGQPVMLATDFNVIP